MSLFEQLTQIDQQIKESINTLTTEEEALILKESFFGKKGKKGRFWLKMIKK